MSLPPMPLLNAASALWSLYVLLVWGLEHGVCCWADPGPSDEPIPDSKEQWIFLQHLMQRPEKS